MAILPQRPLRGSRISSFYPVKSLPSLASLDSAFQLQEYISLLIRLDVHDVDSIVTLPGKRAGKEKEVDESEKNEARDERDDTEEKKNEVTVDEACWIYEQLRRLAQDLTHPLITMLQQECTRASCPEMKAGEWLYLCVAHGTDGNVERHRPPQHPTRLPFSAAEPLSPPVEADIAETALASADVKIASDAMQVQGTSEVFEEPKQEVQEEAKEEELRVEASAEEVKEVADANVEEASEDAPVPEVASKEATLEAQEVAVEASAPAPAPEPVIESVSEITESAPAATTTVEETVAALVDASVELETVVQIPDEAKVVSVTEEKTDAVAELVTKAGAEAEAEARARAEADEEREVEAIAMPVAEEQREEEKQEDKTPELAKEATPVPSS
ncbi:hypothetical protein H0H87_002982 [Tephrocybe sp. NHM501043]|nr:hypothetical protein H0H87_002982 [Tephrocybe sp. NHM501043]